MTSGPADDDLIPMFCDEAHDRLERLAVLLDQVVTDNEARLRARRELHALKGASRMMDLAAISDLCHRAEELLEHPTDLNLPDLTGIHDRLSSMVAGLVKSGDRRVRDAVDPTLETAHGAREGPTAGLVPPSDGMRMRAEVLDLVTERSARLRVLSIAAGGVVERLYGLARLAERGSHERSPAEALGALATSLRELAVEFESGQRRVQRLAERLLDTLLRLQVQPLRPILLSLGRHARQLADTMGKQVRVSVAGGETQLDRRTIDALQEAFLHVVRNAVDHGIEPPGERESAGKAGRGTIMLRATAEGDRVRILVADDGRGIDPDEILDIALARGEVPPELAEALEEEEILQLLFRPGFSTQQEVDQMSGRGIGLDAVAAAVQRVGGDLQIRSRAGEGTTVTVDVPATRRGERVLLLKIGGSLVAMPAAGVRSFRRLSEEMVHSDGGRRSVRLAADSVPLLGLSESLGLPPIQAGTVIEVVVTGLQAAVAADSVVGEEEVFLRPVASRSGVPEIFDSIALLGNGRPVPVLAPQRLSSISSAFDSNRGSQSPSPQVRVLLVDDSSATREMIRGLLENAGLVVTAVGSSEAALRELEQQDFDCLVTDIELPGADGLELTRRVRSSSRLVDLPVIVLSTRDQPQDRRAGMDAGAHAYLTKQELDARELVALVRSSVDARRTLSGS
jgi:chemotaxis protein histidine kinase CheA